MTNAQITTAAETTATLLGLTVGETAPLEATATPITTEIGHQGHLAITLHAVAAGSSHDVEIETTIDTDGVAYITTARHYDTEKDAYTPPTFVADGAELDAYLARI